MPLESATHISDLVTSNPAASDGMNNADDHMRMIKAVLKTDFPSISGPITATHTQINTAIDAVITSGVGKLADAGVFFKTSGDGFVNTLAGDIDVKLQGVIGATFQRTGGQNFFKVTGQIEATTIVASGMCPIGAVLIWPSDTLPPTNEGIFAWCNGAAYSRTTYATCYARIGGAIDATTFAVPNYQEVTLVGKSGMGGAASPGLLASIGAGLKGVLNGLFGANQKTLVTANLPAYTPAGSIANGAISISHNAAANSGGSTTGGGGFGLNAPAGASISASQGASTFTGTAQGGTSTPIDTVQPSKATNFIIRLA